MNLTDLKKKPIEELVEIANSVGVENSDGLLKQELIFEMLKQTSARNGQIYGQGVIEILPDGFGFLRSPLVITIFQDLTIYTFHLLRLENLVSETVTRLQARSDRQRITKNTSHCLR